MNKKGYRNVNLARPSTINQSTGFFARRYALFYAYLDPNPLFSLGEGQTSLLRSVFTAEYEYFRFLFEKLP